MEAFRCNTVITRELEHNRVFRKTVQTAALIAHEHHRLVFQTHGVVLDTPGISSNDVRDLGLQPEVVEGRLVIDVLSDDVFRVRYIEGTSIPDHDTRIMTGTLPGPARVGVTQIVDEAGVRHKRVEVATSSIKVIIDCEWGQILVTDVVGNKICGVGGPEKNFFSRWDAYNTGISRTLASDAPIATECFDLAPGECIYGWGERFTELNTVGQTMDLVMQDAQGVSTPRSYKNVPFFVSTHGYGVFFNHSCAMTAWVGSMSATDVQVGLHDDSLDYVVMTGSIKDVMCRYTALTGKGTVPPRWTFGLWQSKWSYRSAEETLDIAREIRHHKIPCDVIHLDSHWFKKDCICDLEFDPQRFPDPAGYVAELAKKGFKLSLWQLPYIPEGSKLFDDLKAVDGFVKNKDGSIYTIELPLPVEFKGVVGVVDYTNPKAVKVHQDAFRPLFRAGAKVIKTDFGEAAPADGVYHDGTPGHHMHNLYPLLYNQAISEVTQQETGDGVVWARSAWAGSQRFPIHWGGDSSPNTFNLYPQLQGGLSLGLSGFQFWSQDIGGFLGDTQDALLCRWMQMGVFLSHSRVHGVGDRELYKFSPECLAICKAFINLRYELMPYIHSVAVACVQESVPFARALVVEFQDDPNVVHLGDEYLFGPSLLVAPMLTECNERRVYLPSGVWTDWWCHDRIQGERWISVTADLDSMPLFIREGAIIPMGPVMNYVDQHPVDEITVRLGLFETPGNSPLAVHLADEVLDLSYVFDGKNHLLNVSQTRKKIRVVDELRDHVRVCFAQ